MLNKSSFRRVVLFAITVVLGMLTMSISAAQSLDPSLIIFRDEESLTIYVRTPEALEDVRTMQISTAANGRVNTVNVSDHFDELSNSLFFDAIVTPACFRLVQDRTAPIPPDICPASNTFTKEIILSSMFWVDATTRTILTIRVDYHERVKICTNAQPDCPISEDEATPEPICCSPLPLPELIIVTVIRDSNLRLGPGRDYPVLDEGVTFGEGIQICGQQTARYDPSETWLALCEDKGWILAAWITFQTPVTIASVLTLPAPVIPDDCSTVQLTYPTGGRLSTPVRVFWYPYHCPMEVTVNPMGSGVVVAGSQKTKVAAPYVVSPSPAGDYEIKIWDGTSSIPEDFVQITVQ